MEGSSSYSAGLIRSCGLVVPTARASMTTILHQQNGSSVGRTHRDTVCTSPTLIAVKHLLTHANIT
jgi:hypothetical protein